MQQQHLRRLLRLAKKTGDAIVIADSEGGEPMVLMSLDRYESMLDLCLMAEEEMEDFEEEVMPYDEEGEYEAPPVLEDVFEPANEGKVSQTPEMKKEERQSVPDYGTEERFYLEPLEQ